ncbi:uncharacterized protein LOC114751777 [Neltuma alba]|uniref:uncharacterized protein LOC114742902 n=1 Tax=Neltuma alba TaxID=207710 RepID=UPI0010A561B9|nr:uncharacterized protein LOC114742902 [Prosopis alba]XP_028796280.1 uncharacterized protein LOC114751777 [Prosopis alba]
MEPWEALDIDDSDLSSFLRPCKRHHLDSSSKASHTIAANASQQRLIFQRNPHSPPETLPASHCHSLLPQAKAPALPNRLIPGPAGVVQAAMQRRALGHQSLLEDAADSIPTQEFIRRVVQYGDDNDHDFNTNAWHCALGWLRREGKVDRNSVVFGTPLSSIKKQINIERVGQVIAVIKSCTPNGLGDFMVTLKDPSGTIGASVHRKVFTEGEFGNNVKAGSVLVLQKVAVFCPTPSVCYLNITLRNIVKIFSESSEPESEIYPSLRRVAPSIGGNERLSMADYTLSLPQERTEEISTNRSLHLGFKDMEVSDKQKGDDKTPESVGAKQDSGRNHSEHVNIAERVKALSSCELEIETEDNSNPCQLGGDSSACIAQNNGSSAYLVDTSESHGPETGSTRQMDTNREILIPQWTEEQLDELLAFD